MKKLNKFDFLAINRRMNGNWNGGEKPFIGKTKKITKNKPILQEQSQGKSILQNLKHRLRNS